MRESLKTVNEALFSLNQDQSIPFVDQTDRSKCEEKKKNVLQSMGKWYLFRDGHRSWWKVLESPLSPGSSKACVPVSFCKLLDGCKKVV